MNPSKVSDEASAASDNLRSFRRKSIDNGIAMTLNREDYKKISLKQLSKLAASAASSEMKALVRRVIESYIELLKSYSGNVEVGVGEFCDEVIPEGEVLARELLIDLAPKIKPSLKLARIGLGVRMLLSMLLTYMDLITDFLVLKEYGEGGEVMRKFFHISLTILAVSTLVNVLAAWIANKKKGAKAIGKGVLIALIQLNPLVHSLNVWRGVGNSEEDVVDPFLMFLMVRVSELLFEVMPETVLQLFVIYHTKDISWTSTISILSSVASAAFIMTDNSMMFERGKMVSVRGEKAIPDFTHPLHCIYLCFASHRMLRNVDPTLTPFLGSSLLMDPTLPRFNSECSSLTGDSSLVV
jgi:hypothetical protein